MSPPGVEAVAGSAVSGCADEADRAWFAERARRWDDNDWWQAQIDSAVAGGDPVMCNLRITLVHQELSLALARVTGAGSGANFHTWAVWGSKTAGRTIRREDLPRLPQAGAILSALLLAGAASLVGRKASRRVAVPVVGGASACGLLSWALDNRVNRAASRIFGGNATVLEDIGRQTARFLSTVTNLPDERRSNALDDFLAGLRSGPVVRGGQDLLRGAYRHYLDASREVDRDRRDELMLCANLLAILHEHQRLQPYIAASVPRPLRQFVTKRLLGFSVGAEALKVSSDVPTRGAAPFPDTLATIEDPELESLLCGPQGWDRTPDTLVGSAAADWTNLSDRMNFIVDLFRSRQTDPGLFTPPFSGSQRAVILAGHVPNGPL